MNGRVMARICCILLGFCILAPGLAYAVMSLPAGSQFYSYPAAQSPVIHADASQAKPIGVGDILDAHDIDLRIELDSFASPVDIYVCCYIPSLSQDLWLFHPDGNLVPLSAGLTAWQANTGGPVSEGLLGKIPMHLIPSGDYVFYLLVTPAGTPEASLTDNYYFWATSIENLRVLDVSAQAASQFGGDVEAAAAVIMALGNGQAIRNVAKSVLAGTLTAYGEIPALTTAIRPQAIGMPEFCDPEKGVKYCREALKNHLDSLNQKLVDEPFNDTFEEVITAFTMYLASLGYSGSQIHEALAGEIFGTSGSRIDYGYRSNDLQFPFGGIVKDSCADDHGKLPWDCFVEPDARSEIAGLFSDLDPEDFDLKIPGTEGMTFPAYYLGSGTTSLSVSNPNTGSVECSVADMVFVAKVGGTSWETSLLKVYSESWLSTTSSGVEGLQCKMMQWEWEVASGLYSSDGTYHEILESSTNTGAADVYFNKDRLWGSVSGTETVEVLGGNQISKRVWRFDLQRATEADYYEVLPRPPSF